MDGVTGLVGSQQVAKVIWNDEKVYSPKCCPLIFLLTFCFLKGNIRKSMNSKFIIIFFCHISFLISHLNMCNVYSAFYIHCGTNRLQVFDSSPNSNLFNKKEIYTYRPTRLFMHGPKDYFNSTFNQTIYLPRGL